MAGAPDTVEDVILSWVNGSSVPYMLAYIFDFVPMGGRLALLLSLPTTLLPSHGTHLSGRAPKPNQE